MLCARPCAQSWQYSEKRDKHLLLIESSPFKEKAGVGHHGIQILRSHHVMSATGENTVLEDELCVKRAQLSLGRKVKDQSGGRQCKDGERRNWQKHSGPGAGKEKEGTNCYPFTDFKPCRKTSGTALKND